MKLCQKTIIYRLRFTLQLNQPKALSSLWTDCKLQNPATDHKSVNKPIRWSWDGYEAERKRLTATSVVVFKETSESEVMSHPTLTLY